jgi:hypothetical protein
MLKAQMSARIATKQVNPCSLQSVLFVTRMSVPIALILAATVNRIFAHFVRL